MHNNISDLGYSNFLSLSWKIGDTLITAFRNEPPTIYRR